MYETLGSLRFDPWSPRNPGRDLDRGTDGKEIEMNALEDRTENRLFMTVKQTAAVLGVSEKTVYRLLDRKHLKASPLLRHKLITMASIKAFANAANN